uniref:RNA helicase n=1 Tax=Plectus sambesii TaxID=2011161 RepID=A0A914UN69_9BILA
MLSSSKESYNDDDDDELSSADEVTDEEEENEEDEDEKEDEVSEEDEDDESEGDDNDEENEESSDDDEIPTSSEPPTTKKTTPLEEAKRHSFSSLGLSKWLSDQCRQMGVDEPTPVQVNCIPEVLAGRDVLGCSKTGTGKTLAFALPILEQLAVDPYGIYCLVLTPTRELAFQIADQFRALGKPIGLKDAVIVGGRDMIEQSKDLHRRPHAVIATPGRLADHLKSDENGTGRLFQRIKFLVLDEADQLLDGQYGDQLADIFGFLPKKRQTLLFSATITDALSQLHQVSVKKPFFYEDPSEIATVERLDQQYVLCPLAVKDAYLVYVVKNFHEKRPESSILVFSHTCRECQAVAVMFKGLGFNVGSLHSMISQQERLASLSKFRSGRLRILICTDVASRGLDIPRVDLVVNHNVPRSPKTYVHRVGRSARAGRFGSAISFVTQYDVSLLQEIENMVGKKLKQLTVNDKKVTQYVTQVLVAKREAEIKLDKQNFGEKREINKRKQMIMEGIDPSEVEHAIKQQRDRRKMHSKQRVDTLQKNVATAHLKRKKVT